MGFGVLRNTFYYALDVLREATEMFELAVQENREREV